MTTNNNFTCGECQLPVKRTFSEFYHKWLHDDLSEICDGAEIVPSIPVSQMHVEYDSENVVRGYN